MNFKSNNILCQCNKVGSKKESELIICNLCNRKLHIECVGSLKEMKPFYICCQCFLDLDDLFINTISNYINPFYIKPNIREYKIKFKFKILLIYQTLSPIGNLFQKMLLFLHYYFLLIRITSQNLNQFFLLIVILFHIKSSLVFFLAVSPHIKAETISF